MIGSWWFWLLLSLLPYITGWFLYARLKFRRKVAYQTRKPLCPESGNTYHHMASCRVCDRDKERLDERTLARQAMVEAIFWIFTALPDAVAWYAMQADETKKKPGEIRDAP